MDRRGRFEDRIDEGAVAAVLQWAIAFTLLPVPGTGTGVRYRSTVPEYGAGVRCRVFPLRVQFRSAKVTSEWPEMIATYCRPSTS